jgi:hypothetical protein
MSQTKKPGAVYALVLVAAVVMIGCGVSSVSFTPDFNNAELRNAGLKRDSIRIVAVTDRRSPRTPSIGTVHAGAFNRRAPYMMRGEVADVVGRMLDTLLVANPQSAAYLPISVYVDMFEVGENSTRSGEEGYFGANIRFQYPVTPDSQGQQIVFVKETDKSRSDVTGAIEPLIYKGMVSCARSFVEGTLNKMVVMPKVVADSAGDTVKPKPVSAPEGSRQRGLFSQKEIREPDENKKIYGLAFQYLKGDKIKTGVDAEYLMLNQAKNSSLRWGVGFGLTVFDVDNKEEKITGTFVSFGASLMARYMFSDAPTTGYLGGSAELVGGSEQINYGYKSETTFFFGPTLREMIGVSLGGAVTLEAGSFQLAHLGSKMLPSDVGFLAGIGFTF